MQWCAKQDTFGFDIKVRINHSRGEASYMSCPRSPLGFASPYIIFANKFIQDICCEEDFGWDNTVPKCTETAQMNVL